MPVDDVAKDGPGRGGLPRDEMLCHSIHEGSECVSMTWRATAGGP